MRALLVAVIFLVSLSDAQAQSQGCVDPPTLPLGKCFKRAGARCDAATRQWTGGNSEAFNACLCIGGGVKMGYTVEAAKQYCRSGRR
jgi:hypothetical protein